MNVVIVKKGQLGFALEKPKMAACGHEQYPELHQKAAALMEAVTKIHPLSDGNKRMAMMLAELMINANGGGTGAAIEIRPDVGRHGHG